MTFCGNPNCDSEAVDVAFVSESKDKVTKRPLCSNCYNAYMSGCQHARFRAVRNLEQRILGTGDFDLNQLLLSIIDDIDSCDDPGEEDAPFEDEGTLCCYECGQLMVVNENGTTNHLHDDGEVDYVTDGAHVALDPRQMEL